MNVSNWFNGGASGEGRKMSALRVFLIVVALHVLVLGPILIFEGCKNASSTNPEVAQTTEGLPPATDNVAMLPPEPVLNPTQIATAPAAPLPTAIPSTQPLATAVAPVAAVETLRIVKVKSGDSLWKIAKAEGVSLAELIRTNGLTDKSVLRIGQEIKIPSATAKAVDPMTTTAATTVSSSENVYVVQPGDSLWVIAKKHGISVSALREANRLSTNMLKVNQKLVIPASAPKTSSAELQSPVLPEAPKAPSAAVPAPPLG
jgi:LysM repeat protein